MPPSDKIKRNLVWIRKTLGIIDKTTLPGTVEGEVRPTIDAFGWFRYENLDQNSVNGAAPIVTVASAAVPAGIFRLITHCSMSHTDTGVTHLAGINKRIQPGNFNVGLPIDQASIVVGQFTSLHGRTFLLEGEFLIGAVQVATVVGNISLRFFSVDIEIGEYVPVL